MSEETPLQIEMTSSGKASEQQPDHAIEGLQEGRDEEIGCYQRPEYIGFQNFCRSFPWKVISTFFIVHLVLFVVFLIVMTVKLPGKAIKQIEQPGRSLVSPPQCGPPCPRYWTDYEGKCYYFSREKQNWTSSQHYCSSHNASLARIEKEEMDFVIQHKFQEVWIGLKRVLSKDWRWTDGENAMVEVSGEEGDCAYLDNTGKAIASGCHTKLPWICTKPAAYTTQDVMYTLVDVWSGARKIDTAPLG
ncbi:early activation antigen CD69-like [Paroedura picta]|uniref:early activation antigen CD69-like n=1 Tax=Paroedura picta TaxID=143630 RepID=UPI00405646AB